MAKQNPIEEAERTTQLVLVPAKAAFTAGAWQGLIAAQGYVWLRWA